jgi:hypothetical protein
MESCRQDLAAGIFTLPNVVAKDTVALPKRVIVDRDVASCDSRSNLCVADW